MQDLNAEDEISQPPIVAAHVEIAHHVGMGDRGLVVEYRAASALIPFANNARTHSDAQVAQIAGSIREFGWTNPILVDGDNGIIAGHGRLLAARKLGMATVPVIELAGLSDAQKRALVIADNKLALNAGWNDELLGLELGELQGLGFDLSLTGFSELEVLALTSRGTPGLTDPDDIPQVPEQPASVLGDLWLLGNHRLICGDSTNAGDVARVLNGVKQHLCVTDPPYGVEYDPSWRRDRGIASQGLATGAVLNDDRSDWREAWALFPGDVIYCWHAALQSAAFVDSLNAVGFQIRSQIIWDKTRLVIGRGDYHFQHEPCWYSVRKGKTGHWAGDRKQTTVWAIPHRKSPTGHGTEKPVECIRRPIENNSSPGQAVYEPFSGSGTTIIAAEMTGRCCHAVELNPAYVDLAVTRWQDFTGQAAVHAETGATFADVRAQRARFGSVISPRVVCGRTGSGWTLTPAQTGASPNPPCTRTIPGKAWLLLTSRARYPQWERSEMGRPPHEPNPIERRQIEALAGYGVPEAEIAAIVEIDPKTLRKYYRHELDHGHSKANAKVAENLYRKATGDGRESVTAAIFWLKARARWKEVSVHEHGGPDGKPFEPITEIRHIIVSPPDREELRKLPGLAINNPNWTGNPLE